MKGNKSTPKPLQSYETLVIFNYFYYKKWSSLLLDQYFFDFTNMPQLFESHNLVPKSLIHELLALIEALIMKHSHRRQRSTNFTLWSVRFIIAMGVVKCCMQVGLYVHALYRHPWCVHILMFVLPGYQGVWNMCGVQCVCCSTRWCWV